MKVLIFNIGRNLRLKVSFENWIYKKNFYNKSNTSEIEWQ